MEEVKGPSASLLTKVLYTGAAVGGICCLAAGLRHARRVSGARERLQQLLAAAVGDEARIVITGATSGIGKELVQQLHRHPSVTLLLGCRNVKRAEQMFKNEERMQVFKLDLLDPDSVQSFADEAHSFLKGGEDGLRMLVHNAEIMQSSKASLSDSKATWQTNFLAPYLLTELLGRLREKDRSSKRPVSVVQVSSPLEKRSQLDSDLLKAVGSGKEASPNPYADSKRALMLWTSVRAQSLAFKGGLFCHAATPGVVDTQFGSHSVPPWLWPFTKPLRSPAEGALGVAAAGLRTQATNVFGRYMDGEEQLEDLVMERMGEKGLALEVVKWATVASALEQRADGYDR
ncbi:unnamed protein product [Polarella glacialis]|uniref:Protochlorophyllide reductase n=1 Tax=Polarella glacialis TaxID=89957 RepID=A0A813HWM8_POLGL|nr:unnamed protein product [Polarella glacialis]